MDDVYRRAAELYSLVYIGGPSKASQLIGSSDDVISTCAWEPVAQWRLANVS